MPGGMLEQWEEGQSGSNIDYLLGLISEICTFVFAPGGPHLAGSANNDKQHCPIEWSYWDETLRHNIQTGYSIVALRICMYIVAPIIAIALIVHI